MASIFDQFLAGQERGRARTKENRLNELSAQAFAAAPDQQRGFIQQAIANDAGSGFALNKNIESDQDRQMLRLGNAAKYMKQALDTHNPMAVQGAWQTIFPGLVQQGILDPATASPEWRPEYEPLLHQVLSATQSGAGANFASSFIDENGDRIGIMRDGSRVNMGANAPTNKLFDTGAGVVGVNMRDLSAKPVMQGGAPNAAPAPSGTPQFTLDDASLDAIRSLPANERAAALQAMMTGGDFQAGANGEAVPGLSSAPQQVRTVPKPVAPPAPSDFEKKTAFLRAQGVPEAQITQMVLGSTATKPADQAKAEKVAAARSDALDSVNQAIEGIDSLTRSPGFDNLGTFTGDALALLPHSKTRDSASALETVKNQVLLTTLTKLKALSATGASGFGALSNQEGQILKNSIANLETAQSHPAIVKNLKTIQDTLKRAAGLIEGQPAPDSGVSPSAAPNNKVLRFNPATGRIE